MQYGKQLIYAVVVFLINSDINYRITMVHCEIDSFVNKFKLLWRAGYDTSLSLESKLGEVHINLSCKVGRSIPPPSSRITPKYRSPSYFRRQERRRAARESSDVISNEIQSYKEADEALAVADVDADHSSVLPVEESASEEDQCGSMEEKIVEVVDDTVIETEEVDPDEIARNRLVDEILIYVV